MSDYYYPDSVAEFQDYSNDCEPDPFYDFKDNDNPLDLIDDTKESDFIKEDTMLDLTREMLNKKEAEQVQYVCNEVEKAMQYIKRDLKTYKEEKTFRNFSNLCNTIAECGKELTEAATRADNKVSVLHEMLSELYTDDEKYDFLQVKVDRRIKIINL